MLPLPRRIPQIAEARSAAAAGRQTNDDADLGQPVRHLQAHLITQGSLGQLCQWLPAFEPLQLPLMAAEAEM